MNRSGWRTALVVLVGVILAGIVGFSLIGLGGDDGDQDTAAPLPTRTTTTPTPVTPSTTPTPSETTATPTPSATTAEPTCDTATTDFNLEGQPVDSLLPDCDQPPVSSEQQQTSGLGLGCGGAYPVILFKTTTTNHRTSICGKDSTGVDFRVVSQTTAGSLVDLPGTYEWKTDSFVGESEGRRYVVRGYDGSLEVTYNGSTRVEKSSDWISLDNEYDDTDPD